MICRTDAIRTIDAAKSGQVVAIREIEAESQILASGRLAGFRACRGAIEPQEDGVALAPDAAELLKVGIGDTLIHAPG
jgi:arginine N-succinyltransferase